jgi:hypothetical protein
MTTRQQDGDASSAARDVANLGLVRPPLVYLSSLVSGAVIHLAMPLTLAFSSMRMPKTLALATANRPDCRRQQRHWQNHGQAFSIPKLERRRYDAQRRQRGRAWRVGQRAGYTARCPEFHVDSPSGPGRHRHGSFDPLEATPAEKIMRQFSTNVIGLLETTKGLLPHFRANREGIVINTSSIGGKMAFPLGALCQGTKFAVEGLSEALSFELEKIG